MPNSSAARRAAHAVKTAKLDLIAANLPSAGLHVAGASAALIVAFDGSITGLGGDLTIWHSVWLAAQLAITLAFLAVRRLWPAGSDRGPLGVPRDVAYVAIYTVSGVSWGLLTWVAIMPGDVLNQVFLILVVLCISAIYIVRLSAYTPVFLGGCFGLFAIAIPNAWMTENGLASLVAFAAPAWLALLAASAWRLGHQMGEMIEMRLREGELVERLSAAHARAEQESASKSAFLANMSHELRTPLNAIIGFSDVMRAGLFGGLSERYRAYAQDIHASGEHLLSLINDLLDISKIESGRVDLVVEPVPPGDVAQQVMRLLKPRADEKRQTLTLSLAGAPELMMVDPRALKQILLNLAGNAVKYTQPGGTIEIAIRAEGDLATLRVSDNGPGIAKDRQMRLFRPFERLDNSYLAGDGGTGLGLALVRALAELHGGHAALDSAAGRGTRVTVSFPGAAAAAGSLAA